MLTFSVRTATGTIQRAGVVKEGDAVDRMLVRELESAPRASVMVMLDNQLIATFERDRHTGIITRNGDAYLYPPDTALNRWHKRT